MLKDILQNAKKLFWKIVILLFEDTIKLYYKAGNFLPIFLDNVRIKLLNNVYVNYLDIVKTNPELFINYSWSLLEIFWENAINLSLESVQILLLEYFKNYSLKVLKNKTWKLLENGFLETVKK